jgi:hypothetical protein
MKVRTFTEDTRGSPLAQWQGMDDEIEKLPY